jgi:hypothetical protein
VTHHWDGFFPWFLGSDGRTQGEIPSATPSGWQHLHRLDSHPDKNPYRDEPWSMLWVLMFNHGWFNWDMIVFRRWSQWYKLIDISIIAAWGCMRLLIASLQHICISGCQNMLTSFFTGCMTILPRSLRSVTANIKHSWHSYIAHTSPDLRWYLHLKENWVHQ